MDLKIFKYRLKVTDVQTIKLPYRAKVIKIDVQDDKLYLWAEVGHGEELVDRTFYVFGTGQPINVDPHSMKYIDTVQMPPFVWHVYEDTNY